jgi:hypothetical protein
MMGLNPKWGRHVDLEKKSSDNVICSADEAFSFAIWWGCMGSRKAERDTMVSKAVAQGMSKKFTTIITL